MILPYDIQAKFSNILDVASSQKNVREAVMRGHDDSLWWPVNIEDYRIRMLVAGLSTRVSYRMVDTYRQVVDNLNNIGYEQLLTMNKEEVKEVVKKIGLVENRVNFIQSIMKFFRWVEKNGINIDDFSNDELIYLIQKQVSGAAYKVAQCCVLYGRGYYCGVIPVDSGMKDYLGPCLGFPIPNSLMGNEVFRKQLEKLTQEIDCRSIAYKNGYKDLSFPNEGPLTWWVHLVLIYYKRFFCNTRKPHMCPLKNTPNFGGDLGESCLKKNKILGGSRLTIIEGLDGTGKTSLIRQFKKYGYKNYYYDFNEENENLVELYLPILLGENDKRLVLDRSFVSEMVYGNVLREGSRLSEKEYIDLLKTSANKSANIVYLYCEKTENIRRAKKEDKNMLLSHYEELNNQYNRVLDVAEKHLPVYRFDTGKISAAEISEKIFGFQLP